MLHRFILLSILVVLATSCHQRRCVKTQRVASCSRAGHAAFEDRRYRDALSLHWSACSAGSASSCGDVGIHLMLGKGTPEDHARALPYLSKGCDAGHSQSCTFLGRAYLEGLGVTADPARAVYYFQGACGMGDSFGCADLATLYYFGDGVKRRRSLALEMLEEACDANVYYACNEYAWFQCAERGRCTSEERRLASWAADFRGWADDYDTYAYILCVMGDTGEANAYWARACITDEEYCSSRCVNGSPRPTAGEMASLGTPTNQ